MSSIMDARNAEDFGLGIMPAVVEVKDAADWQKAIAAHINQDKTGQTHYVLNIHRDLTLNRFDISGGGNNPRITRSVTLSVRGKGRDTTISLSEGAEKGNLLRACWGVKIILRDIVLHGRADNNTPLVTVEGGEFIMKSGSAVTGNSNAHIHGAGGGVLVHHGKFSMEGSSRVFGNSAGSDGGGVCFYEGTFIMSGNSALYGNSASLGGGALLFDGRFIMDANASIYGNSASLTGGGVYLSYANFMMRGGTIYGQNGQSKNSGEENRANTAPQGRAIFFDGNGRALYSANRGFANLFSGNSGCTDTTVFVKDGSLYKNNVIVSSLP
ncbi:MAG: hypothetical protein LBC67_03075 [Spirochaetales bacterium]|nr:hypothetical protein [Spirochaetales bacterium]